MHLAEINQVIKASPAIQIQGKITHLQRRAWNILLANAYNELPHKDIHSVGVAELAAKLGYKSNDLDYLKDTLRSLRNCEVQWNILGKDKKQEWGVAGLLAEARIKNGICYYEYSHTMRQRLHNPRIYTKLNLRLQNRFSSRYALILWEICFDYFDPDRGKGETPFIPIATFKELMGIALDDYPTFKTLNQRVLKSAINEINNLTDYFVEVEQKRIGRRVAELKFRIERVKQLPVQESVFPDIENLPPVALELVQAQVDRNVALQIADREWDFITPEKLPTPGTYPDFLAYISEKIEMSLSAPNVANRAGYVIEAIRENYQDERVRKARQVRAEKAKEQALEDLTRDFRAQCDTLIRQAVHADPQLVDLAAKRIQSYIVRQRLEEHATAMKAYQQGGMVTAEINAILADQFCQDLLAPVITTYEDEKARILGNIG